MKKILVALLISALFTLPLPHSVHAAANIDALNRQKKLLEQQAQQAREDAAKQRSVAERAASKIELVATQIEVLSGNIQDTNKSIADTQNQVGQKNQEIAGLESDLRKIKDQQDVLVRELYKASISYEDNLALFSDEPLSKRQNEEEAFKALKKSVSSLYTKTTVAKLAVEKNRSDLMKRQQDLENYRVQQDEQQRGLADYKLQQAQLKTDAQQAVVALENKEKAARLAANKIEQDISAALSAIIAARKSGGLGGQGAGQRVSRGTVVGHLGSTGYSTGPHVHFEVRANDTPVNPQPYINNGSLVWPVDDFVITQGFGWTQYAASGAYGGGIHTGIDLAGPYGQPVFAPADGTVIMNQYYGGYGNAWAEQLDNGLVVLLGHMTGK